MKSLDDYKIALIKEILSHKAELIQMGFDWPTNDNLNYDDENLLDDLEQFYADIMGYKALNSFVNKNWPKNPFKEFDNLYIAVTYHS